MEGQASLSQTRTASILGEQDSRFITRKFLSALMAFLVTASAFLGVFVLIVILVFVVIQGVPAITSVQFFLQREFALTVGTDTRGGVANAIIGTIIMLGTAAVMALPIGIFAAVYLAEFGRGVFANVVRFTVDLLSGFPSVVIGVFVWALVVRPRVIAESFSGFAGAVALAIIMVPIVTKTVEEVLRLVPGNLREASLALGVPYWRTVLFVVMPVARNGIITGSVLAMARAGGETAPLLLTAGGNRFIETNLLAPMAAMPVTVYQYTFSPFATFNLRAWGVALILIVIIGLLSIAARLVARGNQWGTNISLALIAITALYVTSVAPELNVVYGAVPAALIVAYIIWSTYQHWASAQRAKAMAKR